MHTYVPTTYYLHQQIWWSSPVSGPRRYDYEAAVPPATAGGWYVKKLQQDGSQVGEGAVDLLATLQEEMQQVTGILVDISRPVD